MKEVKLGNEDTVRDIPEEDVEWGYELRYTNDGDLYDEDCGFDDEAGAEEVCTREVERHGDAFVGYVFKFVKTRVTKVSR